MTTPFFAPDRYDTDRFVLRGYKPGDGAQFADAFNTSYDTISRFIHMPRTSYTVAEAEERIRTSCAAYLNNTDFAIGIFTPDESTLLGDTGFHLRDGPLQGGNGELNMWLRTDQSGKGLGVEVLKAMLDWGFTVWTWQRITWRTSIYNIPSQRVALKAGMIFEARHRQMLPDPQGGARHDGMYYALLKEEWELKRP